MRWRVVLAVLARDMGAWAVLEYRFRHWAAAQRWRRHLLRPLTFVTHLAIKVLGGISVATRAEIGPGLYIGHFGGIIIGPEVRAGENLNLSQNVTIGAHRGSPTIGNQVYLAPGAKVFGSITVGDNVSVGANAVVSEDVPAFSTIVSLVEVLPNRGNTNIMRT